MKNEMVNALDSLTAKAILEKTLVGLIEYHPLPWSVEPDWTLEVVDKNKETVIKIHDQNREQAQLIVDLANSFEKNSVK